METSLEKYSRQRVLSLKKLLSFALLCPILCFTSPAQSAELFDTLKVWTGPRFFVFGEFADDFQTFRFWGDTGFQSNVPVRQIGTCASLKSESP